MITRNRWGGPAPLRRRFTSLIAWTLAVVALVTPGLAGHLGRINFGYAAAGYLNMPMNVARVSFVTSVGGVAFNGVAGPADGSVILGGRYDPSRPDGQRLVLDVRRPGGDTATVFVDAYDWELAPLLRVVQRGGESLVTLFGKLKDRRRQFNVLRSGGMVANYHEGLSDTLLGLRLLQADMILMTPNAAELPQDDADRYVLGAGEAQPDVAANRARFEQLTGRVLRLGGFGDSYVICDEGRTVQFAVEDGRLVLSGQPVWYCWRYDASGVGVARMEARSEQITAEIEECGYVNPAVERSLLLTMRVSALLRHLKASAPDAFDAVARDVAAANPAAATRTPTTLTVKP
jgi:hypothetical protein